MLIWKGPPTNTFFQDGGSADVQRRLTDKIDVKIENLEKMTIPPATPPVNVNPLDSCEKITKSLFRLLFQYGGSLNHKKPCEHKVRDVLRNQSNIQEDDVSCSFQKELLLGCLTGLWLRLWKCFYKKLLIKLRLSFIEVVLSSKSLSAFPFLWHLPLKVT